VIERLERLLNLVIALRETRRPLPAAEIRARVAGYGQGDAAAFRRMFERDKADLRALGVPVETAPIDRLGDEVGYRIDPRRYDLPPVNLEPDELAALAVALRATGLHAEAGSGLLKLAVDAGEPAAAAGADGAAPAVEVDLAGPHRTSLLEAQLTRTTVRFGYTDATGHASERTVDPHALVHRRGRWYVVGHDHDRGERRAFRLDRIASDVRTASEPGAFAPPTAPVAVDDVVPAARTGEHVEAQVLAAPAVAWQVARVARGGGRVAPSGPAPEAQSDEWTTFTIGVRDDDTFASWALQFGPDLEVVAPARLRDLVRARLAATLEAQR
jgi:predicted DNA-binding transcriptional regulator YafY